MDFRRAIRWGLVICVLLGCVVYALAIVCVWRFQEHFLFGRRSAVITRTPDVLKWPYEDVWADVPGGRTHGWWIPVDNARGVVLYSHGSGRNISHHLEDMAFFRDMAFSVLMYDYGGYGQSTGAPSEARCYADSRAMWAHLTDARHIPPERILLMGSSMGGGVTADLAAEVKAGAVILESTFVSVPDVVAAEYPWLPIRLIARIHFSNIDKVGRIQCPVLVIHSPDDTVVPFAHGRRLFDRVSGPKTFLEIRGGHTGGKFTSREVYAAGLKRFVDGSIR